jgi:predicted transcriptional regulator YdeE
MSNPATVTFQVHQDEFSFLGIENILTESANFGHFWDNFFKLGGYDEIYPYATDPKPINVWYTKNTGEKVYFQGLMVKNVDEVPEGYTLAKFPASDFIVVTHDWLPTYSEAQGYGIDAGWKNIKTVEIPDGYVRNDGEGSEITVIERDNHDTPDGSRIEFWVPIKKKPKTIEEKINSVLLNKMLDLSKR